MFTKYQYAGAWDIAYTDPTTHELELENLDLIKI